MFRQPRCTEQLGGSHNFEPRYDERPGIAAVLEATDQVRYEGPATALSRQRTYVQDVCTWCGKVVPRAHA